MDGMGWDGWMAGGRLGGWLVGTDELLVGLDTTYMHGQATYRHQSTDCCTINIKQLFNGVRQELVSFRLDFVLQLRRQKKSVYKVWVLHCAWYGFVLI